MKISDINEKHINRHYIYPVLTNIQGRVNFSPNTRDNFPFQVRNILSIYLM